MNTDRKILNKILANQIQQYIQKSHTHDKWDLFQEYKFNIAEKINQCIHHINRTEIFKTIWYLSRQKKQLIKSNTLSLLKKKFNKLGREDTFLNLIKDIYARIAMKKSTANILLNSESFHPRSGTKQGCVLLPLLFNFVLKVLARASTLERKSRTISIYTWQVSVHKPYLRISTGMLISKTWWTKSLDSSPQTNI